MFFLSINVFVFFVYNCGLVCNLIFTTIGNDCHEICHRFSMSIEGQKIIINFGDCLAFLVSHQVRNEVHLTHFNDKTPTNLMTFSPLYFVFRAD